MSVIVSQERVIASGLDGRGLRCAVQPVVAGFLPARERRDGLRVEARCLCIGGRCRLRFEEGEEARFGDRAGRVSVAGGEVKTEDAGGVWFE